MLILGIGNTLLTDEGIGVHAMRALERLQQSGQIPEDVEFLDGGTLGFSLCSAINGHSPLIVIDAAELGTPPGSVRVFEADSMDGFVGRGGRRSVHEVTLADLLFGALVVDRLPDRRALIGIQPAVIDWGDAPSPAAVHGIGEACDRAIELMSRWRS